MQMPVMDGLAATRALRLDHGMDTLPVVAMTANAMDADRDACLAAGMNDHIGKPFDMHRLVAKVLQWSRHAGEPEAPTGVDGTLVPPLDTKPEGRWLNTPAAVARMGGSAGLHTRLAQQFAKDLSGTRARLAGALERQDAVVLRQQLHAAKGAAATVGAERLARLLAEAEKRCAQGAWPVWADLEAAIDGTRSAIAAALPPLQAECDASPTLSSTIDWAPTSAQRDALRVLLNHLQGADMAAFDALTALTALPPPPPGGWAALDQLVQDIRFEEAAHWCELALA